MNNKTEDSLVNQVPDEPVSILFREELSVIGANASPEVPQKTKSPPIGIDIQELSKKIGESRKQKQNSNHLLFLNKFTNRQDFGKIENTIDISKDLDKIREKSKKVHVNSRINKPPRSVKKANLHDNESIVNGSNNASLTMQLQRSIDEARMLTKHAILKRQDVNELKEGQFIGVLKNIQVLSESLKIIDILICDINGNERDDDSIQIGLVCLWNEWIDIKVNDLILFLDLPLVDVSNNSNNLPWCFQWKKLVGF